MRIHTIQHVPFEGPGAIREWAIERGHMLTITGQWSGAPLPKLDEFDFLVVMGGSMSANDEANFAWLVPEKKLIRDALEADKPILGVCLGAQLLANALGARVYKNRHKEIGWFPVKLASDACTSALVAGLPETLTVLHWHGETYDLPRGARLLASSEACLNQAFEFGGRTLALQFHMEVGREGLEKLVQYSAEEIDQGPYVQSAATMLAAAKASDALRPALYQILDRLAEAAES